MNGCFEPLHDPQAFAEVYVAAPGVPTWPTKVRPEGTPEENAMELDLAPEALGGGAWRRPAARARCCASVTLAHKAYSQAGYWNTVSPLPARVVLHSERLLIAFSMTSGARCEYRSVMLTVECPRMP